MPAEADLPLAYLCLGANLGERAGTMARALAALEAAGLVIAARSSLYETPPWGPIPQPAYLNQVVAVRSPVGPLALLDLALQVERDLGRDRSREVRFGPRAIDIDILLFAGESLATAGLTLPHPRLLERAFALVPLLEIAPDIAIGDVPARLALERLDPGAVRRLAGP